MIGLGPFTRLPFTRGLAAAREADIPRALTILPSVDREMRGLRGLRYPAVLPSCASPAGLRAGLRLEKGEGSGNMAIGESAIWAPTEHEESKLPAPKTEWSRYNAR